MQTYQIYGGDDAAYGPCFGPVIADETGVVPSVGGGHILLTLRETLNVKGIAIRLLAVRPRYVGDTLDTIHSVGATVGIWRVLPEAESTVSIGITSHNAEYWSIGTCTPL